jgi:hypothetical protein
VAMLPLNFGLPPLAGWIRDITGSYRLVEMFLIAECATVAIMFFAVAIVASREAPMPVPEPAAS